MPIGQELRVDRYADPFKIVGVLEDLPANTHFEFELLLSYASCIKYWILYMFALGRTPVPSVAKLLELTMGCHPWITFAM